MHANTEKEHKNAPEGRCGRRSDAPPAPQQQRPLQQKQAPTQPRIGSSLASTGRSALASRSTSKDTLAEWLQSSEQSHLRANRRDRGRRQLASPSTTSFPSTQRASTPRRRGIAPLWARPVVGKMRDPPKPHRSGTHLRSRIFDTLAYGLWNPVRLDSGLGRLVCEVIGMPVDFGQQAAIAKCGPSHLVHTAMGRHPHEGTRAVYRQLR